MKKEVCLMCIVCFFLGYFIADIVSKCGFGREHLTNKKGGQDVTDGQQHPPHPHQQPHPHPHPQPQQQTKQHQSQEQQQHQPHDQGRRTSQGVLVRRAGGEDGQSASGGSCKNCLPFEDIWLSGGRCKGCGPYR